MPASGYVPIEEDLFENLRHYILPATTIGLLEVPIFLRVLRVDLIATLQEDYIALAKAKGLSRTYILFNHALRPSSFTLVTVLGLQFGFLISGTVIIEQMFGLPGIKNLNYYFKKYKKQKFQNITLISKLNSSKISYCPIITGVNFLDQINILQELDEITFENVACPVLLVPFLSRASEIVGKKIFLKIDEKEFLLNLNQSIYSNYLKNEILENSSTVNISFIENNNLFNENEWKELYRLSEDTFVEETESSKIGAAGAGLTDND